MLFIHSFDVLSSYNYINVYVSFSFVVVPNGLLNFVTKLLSVSFYDGHSFRPRRPTDSFGIIILFHLCSGNLALFSRRYDCNLFSPVVLRKNDS